MSYEQDGLIQAVDFNTLVGGNPTTTANTLNATWATGGGSAGYGQTPVGNVAVGDIVSATEWNSLINNASNSAAHQGSSITALGNINAGDSIQFLSDIPNNLSTIYTNRLNAANIGSTSSDTATRGTTWANTITFTHTVTFANGDAARYFFNSGGQLKITCSHPSGTGIDLLFNSLASNIGTVVISAPSSGSISIAGTTYNGVTKIGGGGNSPTIQANEGYYGLSTANTTVFTQTASQPLTNYDDSFISIIAKTNGVQGSNSDNGNVITIYTVWDEDPSTGLTVSSGSATTLTVQAPETTNIANTWGSISVSGTVSGS